MDSWFEYKRIYTDGHEDAFWTYVRVGEDDYRLCCINNKFNFKSFLEYKYFTTDGVLDSIKYLYCDGKIINYDDSDYLNIKYHKTSRPPKYALFEEIARLERIQLKCRNSLMKVRAEFYERHGVLPISPVLSCKQMKVKK